MRARAPLLGSHLRELLEVAGLERGPNRSQLPAELRPEHREIRLDAKLARLDLAERDLLDAKLLGDLVRIGPEPARAPSTTRARSGWRSLTPAVARACRPSSTTRRSSPISARRAESGAATVGQPARMTRLGSAGARRRQPTPEVVGEKRHERRDDTQPLDERVPERTQRRLVAIPESPPRAPDVPVRDVVDERLVRTDDVDREPALVGRRSPRSRVRSFAQRASGRAARGLPTRPTPRDRPSRAPSPRRCSRSRRGTCRSSRG